MVFTLWFIAKLMGLLASIFLDPLGLTAAYLYCYNKDKFEVQIAFKNPIHTLLAMFGLYMIVYLSRNQQKVRSRFIFVPSS